MNKSDQNDAFVVVDNVSFSRGEKIIFKDIQLHIRRRQITAIMGPSGTGKTTLLRLIGGELSPTQGTITLGGLNVHRLSNKQLYNLRRRMGILFQQGGLFSDLDVFENVAFPLREHTDLPEDMIHDLVLMQLQAVGLRGAVHLKTEQLSGGMARRVAMARATILSPELMLYDEPFTGQDPISRGVLLQLIRQLNKALRLTSVLVSHDVTETFAVADYIYILADGTIIGEGTPSEIEQHVSPQVQQFIQGLPDGPMAFDISAADYREDLKL